jgi:hypothetical protein
MRLFCSVVQDISANGSIVIGSSLYSLGGEVFCYKQGQKGVVLLIFEKGEGLCV